ncbi:GTP-binding and nucleic acid-binding protein YchF [Desulfocucumis palustris]|uniref:Ribosome-binding ATPase YchF n=1 Tax=Desulfocucumis palustris TaxID=1898651 RepID=A0A2L2X8N5_9FIRM|nr:redox-regulated ATPase YchF [Desulfocucumis palustris]GBF32579.1 GTP-binding and nucleic acid-binding protein YchF [Desulfocucumis palustris]
MLTAGIIGLPMVGKTTVFNLVTNAGAETSNFLSGKTETNVSMARIPDRRVDLLSGMFKPKKTIFAQVQFSDVPGLVRGSSQGKGVGNQFLEGIRNADLLIHVVRAFNNGNVPHVDGDVDPLRDIETIDMELLFADMELVEKRILRIEGGKKITKENAAELQVLKKCYAALENEVPLHSLELTEEERGLLVNYNMLTEKKVIWVINTDEGQFKSGNYPHKKEVEELAAQRGIKHIEVCGLMEAEISELPPEDRELFMSDLGLTELGVERLALAAYDTLGLISFFTVGEDEVKAWTIHRDTDAKRAAGKIHSDIERGFIRAEVVKYADLIDTGSMARVKEKGLARLEGKEYIVQDGDIINFRFNV